ncbi:hypothetical protein PPL_05642 [Heterostelium album PN500]|uniref:Ubiquitin-like domain-containing protein n=1 Tax=Heterostelium pallidum (strain ATCC 26659 / Pp 5 / PN500) TaxID=670386 RepID=D3BAR2_HETP5|nr:hypothetical protein PPL_05642 [Heterostelium album PN500]EFA81649.1 hypothetical protein PPL_05642 [Heterostelium album PN500]|eukprot:XP_020433766.1 hypothetical protein PPL_05642 [Heterostelium album PN500]
MVIITVQFIRDSSYSFQIEVEENYSVGDLKQKIEYHHGLLADDTRIIVAGKGLGDHHFKEMGDTFINLSHLLLSNIVKYLHSNHDKIIFSLVCRRWFYEKDKYLCLKNMKGYHRQNLNKQNYNLTSFNHQLSAIEYRKSKKYIFYKDDTQDDLDYIEIEDQMKKIIFQSRDDEYLYLSQSFRDRLARSNIDTLEIHCVLKIKFDQFPSNIKKMSIFRHYCSTDFKWLPESLESLTLLYHYKTIVSPFTSTLRHLEFSETFAHQINISLLPPLLEVLICFKATFIATPSTDGSKQDLPSSLTRLSVHAKYLPLLRNLGALRDLKLLFTYNEENQLRHGDLPSTITKLKFVEITGQLWSDALALPEIRHLEFINSNLTFGKNVFSHLDRLESLIFNGVSCRHSIELVSNV